MACQRAVGWAEASQRDWVNGPGAEPSSGRKTGLRAGGAVLAKLANDLIVRVRCSMPTRNVSLTKELDQFVAAEVEGGLYANASEVMRAALRLLEKEKREYEEKLTALKAAIAEGDASGDAEEGVFERIRQKYGLPQKEKCA
jgi:antitoxin ParD1/3/4